MKKCMVCHVSVIWTQIYITLLKIKVTRNWMLQIGSTVVLAYVRVSFLMNTTNIANLTEDYFDVQTDCSDHKKFHL